MHRFKELSEFAKNIIINKIDVTDIDYIENHAIVKKYLDLYFEELKQFESMNKYDAYLQERIAILEKDINIKLSVVYTILINNDMKISDAPKPINKGIENGKTYLRINIADPLYEGLKYLASPLYKLSDSAYEYIINTVESKFLALGSTIENLLTDERLRIILTRDALKTAHILISFICPSQINENQLVFLNHSDIIFRMTKNITLGHMTDIYNSLIKNELIKLNGLSLELIEVTEINDNGTVKSVHQII